MNHCSNNLLWYCMSTASVTFFVTDVATYYSPFPNLSTLAHRVCLYISRSVLIPVL